MSLKQVDEDIIISNVGEQVMMKWEKPYMEASIDVLNPTGDVLEIGFGLGYSATQIMKHNPKSYTIIECESLIIENIKKWAKKYPDIPTTIVEGKWQSCLHNVGIFDEIYFDDYPLDITEKIYYARKKFLVTKDVFGLQTSVFKIIHVWALKYLGILMGTRKKLIMGSDSTPFIHLELKSFDIGIPETCKYRNIKEQLCTIPLLTKVKEYDFQEAQRLALEQIETDASKIKFL